MHSDGSTTASKKRKDQTRLMMPQNANEHQIPAASLHPLLNTLTDAYGSALAEEVRDSKSPPVPAGEEWNWELTTEQIARLSKEELTIWKDLLPCRHPLRVSGIKIHPFNWKMPVVDLRQWQAHIPGRKGTPWEGGVYSLDVIFSPGSAEYVVPKLRFIRPLFHPNASPSGTWSYSGDPGVKINYVYGDTWVKTKYDGPERFAQLLQTVQNTLHEPNLHDPAQGDAYLAAKNDFEAYEEQIRAQAKRWTPDPRTGLTGRPILHSS